MHPSRHIPSPKDDGENQNTDSPAKDKYLLPKRIIMIRHGESLGNTDETAYARIPDWKIPLTRRGERQALRAANDLAELLKGETLFAYCSPYKRAKETWDIMAEYLRDTQTVDLVGMREEPRIAEQQFGNFQNPHKVRTAKAERRTFGRFFFRFPNGEAGLDVYNRVSSFLATVSRDIRQLDERYSTYEMMGGGNTAATTAATTSTMDSHNHKVVHDAMENMNILIVCHGLTLRLLLMRYFQLTVEEFENSYNSQNAKLVVMDRFVDPSSGREFYRLHEEAKQALNLKGDVSNERPVYWRMNESEAVDRGLLLFDEKDFEE